MSAALKPWYVVASMSPIRRNPARSRRPGRTSSRQTATGSGPTRSL